MLIYRSHLLWRPACRAFGGSSLSKFCSPLFSFSLNPPDLQDTMALVFGVCFRMSTSSRSSDSVRTTAAATLRQAASVIFDRLSEDPPPPASSADPAADPHEEAPLLLLDDLCALASGQPAAWLQVPQPPRAFALDVLDFILGTHSEAFRKRATLAAVVEHKVCPLLARFLQARTLRHEQSFTPKSAPSPGFFLLCSRCRASPHSAGLAPPCLQSAEPRRAPPCPACPGVRLAGGIARAPAEDLLP